MNGTIIKKFPDKGFGFIRTASGSEVFFHISNCITRFDNLNERDEVRFDTIDSPKGQRAVEVTKL